MEFHIIEEKKKKKYYSLDDGSEKWADNIIKETKSYKRKNTTELIKKSGYDVKIAAKKMEELYLS